MKKLLPVLMVWALLLSTWGMGYAYDFTISGKVSFANDETPVPFGFVIATADNGEVQETPTDPDGNYSLTFDIEDGTIANIIVTTFDLCTGEEISTDVISEGDAAVVDFEICDEINFPTCQAAFEYIASESNPLEVEFLNASFGEATSWSWDFGDGNTSSEENPTHTYAEDGLYEVVLSISGDDCESTTVQVVFVDSSEPCACDFVFDPVCVEDENGNILPFPNACFAECEGYTVDDFVECDNGNPGDCWAAFSYDVEEPSSLIVQFNDLSSGNPSSWSWDFGDGNTSEEQNPSHTYAEAGIYDVTLTISGDDCEATTIQHICIGEGINPFEGCQALFFSTPLDGFSVQFEDVSFGEATAWSWDFGDGNTSDEQSPLHTYAEEGEYIVSLTITADSCTSTIELPVHVGDVIGNPCNCNFEFDPVCVEDADGNVLNYPSLCFAECDGYSEDDLVECENIGNPCECDFVFDPVCVEDADGNVLNYPSLCFAECDGYSEDDLVECENTINPCECDFVFDPVCVLDTLTGTTIPFPNACFAECEGYTDADFVECDNGSGGNGCYAEFYYLHLDELTLEFVNLSSGDELSWLWDFGDGNTSTEQNPTHTYAEEGEYEVTLTITGEDCEESTMQYVIIGGGIFPCGCDFVFDPVCVLDDLTGEIIPFPNACWAECEGYTEGDFVECDNGGGGSECQAFFYYTQEDPTSNTVSFIEDSWLDNVVSWAWDFGDGNTSDEQNPTHTYADGGIYDVTLTITTDDGCTSTTVQHICIGEGVINYPFPDCQAFFFFEQHENDMLNFNFTDLSFGENLSWAWDFGDGNTSTEQNPNHTYAEPGTYEVNLTVSSDSCESSFTTLLLTDWDAWYNGECNALFIPLIIDDAEVVFINASSADAVTYAWDFGDGTTSNEPFPAHTYTQSGSYDVTLTITTEDGCINSYTMTIDLAESEFFATANSIDLSSVSTNNLENIKALKAFPNPVIDELTIEFEATEASTYQIEVIDLTGKTLLRDQRQVLNGQNSLLLNVSTLPEGMYLTRLSNAKNNFSVKFVK